MDKYKVVFYDYYKEEFNGDMKTLLNNLSFVEVHEDESADDYLVVSPKTDDAMRILYALQDQDCFIIETM